MLDFLQPIFPFAFSIAWLGPSFFLGFRFHTKQAAYLRRFPPINRYQTLDMYLPWVGNPPGTYRRIKEAMWQRQPDLVLERLRRGGGKAIAILPYGSSDFRFSPSA